MPGCVVQRLRLLTWRDRPLSDVPLDQLKGRYGHELMIVALSRAASARRPLGQSASPAPTSMYTRPRSPAPTGGAAAAVSIEVSVLALTG